MIKTKDGTTIYSTPNIKILGFIFSEKPNVEAQIASLIRKANSRTIVIRLKDALSSEGGERPPWRGRPPQRSGEGRELLLQGRRRGDGVCRGLI